MSPNVLQSVLADYDSRKEFLEVPLRQYGCEKTRDSGPTGVFGLQSFVFQTIGGGDLKSPREIPVLYYTFVQTDSQLFNSLELLLKVY